MVATIRGMGGAARLANQAINIKHWDTDDANRKKLLYSSYLSLNNNQEPTWMGRLEQYCSNRRAGTLV